MGKRKHTNVLPNEQNHAFWQDVRSNETTYWRYYNRLVALSCAMFEWKNLPETVDPRYLELCLFGLGNAVFFKDEVLGYLALKCVAAGPLDCYGVPMVRTGYSDNGYNIGLDEKNSVIIWNNMLRTNSVLDVQYYAEVLSELDQTIKVNLKAQKTPVLIICDEDQRLTMKNVYTKYDGNEPFIYGTKALNKDAIKVLKTDAPYLAKDLYETKTQYWNEALTYLGITNISYQKKERLISDEAIRSQGGTIANRYDRLNARRQACDEINRMFGLNIQCDFRMDYREADDEVMIQSDSDTSKDFKEMDDMVVDIRTN